MRLWEKISTLTVSKLLRVGKSATVEFVDSLGTTRPVPIEKMATRVESVTTTNVITAAESGTRFILNSATGFVSTLPAPAADLEFWFYIGATAPTTSHTIVTTSSANIIEGSISTREDALGVVACVAAADTITFVANKAVRGDQAHVWSDGTNWFLDGMCFVQDGMTTTQAS